MCVCQLSTGGSRVTPRRKSTTLSGPGSLLVYLDKVARLHIHAHTPPLPLAAFPSFGLTPPRRSLTVSRKRSPSGSTRCSKLPACSPPPCLFSSTATVSRPALEARLSCGHVVAHCCGASAEDSCPIPENRCVRFYHPERKDGRMLQLCRGDTCTCAEGENKMAATPCW